MDSHLLATKISRTKMDLPTNNNRTTLKELLNLKKSDKFHVNGNIKATWKASDARAVLNQKIAMLTERIITFTTVFHIYGSLVLAAWDNWDEVRNINLNN